MKRLSLFAVFAAVMLAVAWPSAMIPASVTIDTGALEGVTGTVHPTVRIFKGIPFAAPPLGENRWKAPQPAAKWTGVRKADAFGPSCVANGGAGRGGRGGGAPGGAPGRGAAPGGAPGAAAPAAAAPQATAAPPAPPRQPPANEDCLTVNVWTNANDGNARRPVMMWIYGGGFTGGSGGQAWYDGEDLAAKGAVIVTMNYRLGGFGFFAHPELAKEAGRSGSGNYGVMDAIAALQWIKRNIRAFGGDPNNVTIAGESAGAIMVGALVGSPQAKGLFNRAVVESGAWMGLQMGRMTTAEQAQGNGAKALQTAGINSIAELRAKPFNELPNLPGNGMVIDGYLFPEDLSYTFAAGKQNDVDLIAGSNKDENTFFGGGGGGGRGGGRGGGGAAAAPPPAGAAMQAYIDRAKQQHGELADTFLKLYPVSKDEDVALMNAQFQNDEINWNMRQFAALQSKKGKKGYAYFFTRVPLQNGQPSGRGASHTAEISYVFNHAYSNGPLEWNEVDKKLADQMSSYWVNFFAKGDPNGSGLPAWPQYKDMSKDKAMVLGDTVQVEATVPAEKMAFFNARYARFLKAPAGTN
ncbi:MAG TPA: carboxylesterase family protein [Vicinamibacterales bacterium]|nr:carboxylesterase family protein [Vicinamibacterales bacterium]